MSITHISKLLDEPEEESKWLIDRLIPEGGITVISGNPASFKTWIALHMAASIASGQKVFGEFTTTKKNVLVIEEDDRRSSIRSRMKMMSPDKDSGLYFQIDTGFKVDDGISIECLDGALKHRDIGVVFIDSLVRIHGGNENEAKDAAAVFDKLHGITRNGVTVVIIHHHRKTPTGSSYDRQPLRGSSDILAAVDCHLSVEKRGKDMIRVDQRKLRIAREADPFLIDVKSDETSISFAFKELDLEQVIERTTKKDKAEERIGSILAERESVDRSELVSLLRKEDIGQSSVDAAIEDMTRDGTLSIETGARGKKILRLSEPS